jgi:hypothetical protein
LRNNKDVVMAACAQNGFSVRYASRALRGDLDVCEAACAQAGVRAMRYFATERRGERDLVLALVAEDGHALKYASLSLRSDASFVLEAASLDCRALEYAAPSLQDDKSFRKAARKILVQQKDIDEKRRQDRRTKRATEKAVSENAASEEAAAGTRLQVFAGVGESRVHAEADIVNQRLQAKATEEEDAWQLQISSSMAKVELSSDDLSAGGTGALLFGSVTVKAQTEPNCSVFEVQPVSAPAPPISPKLKGESMMGFFESFSAKDTKEALPPTSTAPAAPAGLAAAHPPAVLVPSETATANVVVAPLLRALNEPISTSDAPSLAPPKAAGLLVLAAFGGAKGAASFGGLGLGGKLGSEKKGRLGALKFAAKLKAKVIGVHRHTPLASAPLHAREDQAFVLASVQRAGVNLKFASPALRGDRSVVLAACAQNGDALRYADVSLRRDAAFVLACASGGSGGSGGSTSTAAAASCVSFASAELREDRTFWVVALAANPACLGYATPFIRADKALVLTVVARRGQELHSAYPLWADPAVVRAAISQDPHALAHASPEMRSDRTVVAAALEIDGLALKHATDELRDDNAVRRRNPLGWGLGCGILFVSSHVFFLYVLMLEFFFSCSFSGAHACA